MVVVNSQSDAESCLEGDPKMIGCAGISVQAGGQLCGRAVMSGSEMPLIKAGLATLQQGPTHQGARLSPSLWVTVSI